MHVYISMFDTKLVAHLTCLHGFLVTLELCGAIGEEWKLLVSIISESAQTNTHELASYDSEKNAALFIIFANMF